MADIIITIIIISLILFFRAGRINKILTKWF